jgi:hypothetical protein
MAFVNNYSTSFRWWDHLLGTDDKYNAYRSRVSAAKASERAAVEARENEETEREGMEAERKLLARGGAKVETVRNGEETTAEEEAPKNVLRMAGEAESKKAK